MGANGARSFVKMACFFALTPGLRHNIALLAQPLYTTSAAYLRLMTLNK